MGKIVLRDCQVTVNAVNLSDHASSVEINFVKDEVETTNFSGQGRERIAGLKDDSFVITFQQDYAVGEVNATLSPLYNNENEFTVVVNPALRSATLDLASPGELVLGRGTAHDATGLHVSAFGYGIYRAA